MRYSLLELLGDFLANFTISNLDVFAGLTLIVHQSHEILVSNVNQLQAENKVRLNQGQITNAFQLGFTT